MTDKNLDYWYSKAAEFASESNIQGVLDSCAQLIKLSPGDPQIYFNYGSALHQSGKLTEAKSAYIRCIELDKTYVNAYLNLSALLQGSDITTAIEYLKTAHELQPQNISIKQQLCSLQFNNGNRLSQDERYDEAIINFHSALKLMPNQAVIMNSLGVAYLKQKKFSAALDILLQAIKSEPALAYAYSNLGNVYEELGDINKAISNQEKAIELDSNLSEAYYNLANLLTKKNKFVAAISYYQQAIKLQPKSTEIYNNLGNAQVVCGQVNEAIESYRKAVQIDAGNATAHSNLLFTLMCLTEYSQQDIFKQHIGWAKQHCESTQKYTGISQNSIQHKKIRIAYLSPDFREHSVASFIEPILRGHNKNKFEIYCYANVKYPDKTSDRLKGYCQKWRDIYRLDDDQAACMIQEDEIDILVDLAGHSSGNRLLLLAKKPAPIQITYLGYPNTTGLTAVDYRITDEWSDPLKHGDEFYSEKLLRMPAGFLCYQKPLDAPKISQVALSESNTITFCSFNNLAKISPTVIEIWGRVLQAVPDSRLLLKHMAFEEAETRSRYIELFARQGISADRIEFISWVNSKSDHLDIYNKADIALDTFPYNGTTTSCEALWMGIPLITLAGDSHVSRVGVSILNTLNMSEMIADDADEFVAIAKKLSADKVELNRLKNTLRATMEKSSLCDDKVFVSELETLYQKIYQDKIEEAGVYA